MAGLLPIEAVRSAANADPEFRLAARFWNIKLRLSSDDEAFLLGIQNGEIVDAAPAAPDATCDLSIKAPAATWREMLTPVPRPFYQDLLAAANHYGLRLEGDLLSFFAYYPALSRLVAVMRETSGAAG